MLDNSKERVARFGRNFSARALSGLTAGRLVAEAFRGLLSNRDVKMMSAPAARRISGYARERFGSTIYAPWLLFYATYRGRFVEGWIPDNFFQEVAVGRLNGTYHLLDNARTLQARLLGPGALPDIAHFVSGEWRDVDGALLDPATIAERLFADCDEICIKTQQSSKGRGVSFVGHNSFDRAAVEALGDFVVQRRIAQHDALGAMFPNAVTTIRITTGKLRAARPVSLFANLRLGRGAARAVTLGSIKVPILDDDGALDRCGADHDWRLFTEHPDTGFRFERGRVPEFGRMQAYCLALHERLPQFGLIGWDVTADAAGDIHLLELNTGHPGIKFAEATVGPCLRAFDMERYAARR
jgi:hypothetical protein